MSAPFQTSVFLELVTIFLACSVVSVRLAMNWTEVAGTAQVRRPLAAKFASRGARGLGCWGPAEIPQGYSESQTKSWDETLGITEYIF